MLDKIVIAVLLAYALSPVLGLLGVMVTPRSRWEREQRDRLFGKDMRPYGERLAEWKRHRQPS